MFKLWLINSLACTCDAYLQGKKTMFFRCCLFNLGQEQKKKLGINREQKTLVEIVREDKYLNMFYTKLIYHDDYEY